ncbi:MAG: 50S ribosomal protein L32 [Bdellovibrionota bacterium]
MPVPKKKTSSSKRDMRRSHDALTAINTITCQNCDSAMRPHRVCPNCGQYRGKQVVDVNTETE